MDEKMTAEAVSDRDLSEFYVVHRLSDRFEQKLREMELAFDSLWASKNAMGLSGLTGLTAINNELGNKLSRRPRGRA
jgi:hypothetical protein